jgi:hypothetical protein
VAGRYTFRPLAEFRQIKPRRPLANKVPFVIAVATRKNKPIYTQLRCVPGFTKEAIKWTNTGLGNIKSAIAGTCRSFYPQHTERYLASYEWRFNRRFDLDKNVERLARVATQTAPA